MHVVPAIATFDGRKDKQTDNGQSIPYVVFCSASATKIWGFSLL